MKSRAEWEQDILSITVQINSEFPELSKFMKEIPIKDLSDDDDEINCKILKEYYQSLVEISKEYAETHETVKEQKKLPGYPIYPTSEDIYNQEKKESVINPDNLSEKKAPNSDKDMRNEKNFEDDMSGDDLDIPGSELDDQQESIGNEDEENNYYSLGGDNHNNLDEDNR